MTRLGWPTMRLGGTSWVVPGSFADNLRELSKEAGDMQLVLFDNGHGSNIPSPAEVRELAALKKELGMSCTVHFPDDVCLSAEMSERRRCEDSCLRMMELFAPLEPFAWILHLDGDQYGSRPSAEMERWLELSLRSLERLAGAGGKRICAETLDYDFHIALPLVREAGVSICLDAGHLVRYGHPVEEQARSFLPWVRAVHIHGVRPDGTDHVDMGWFDAGLFRRLAAILTGDGAERVMTLEVFEDDYSRSIEAVKSYMKTEETQCSTI